MHNRWGLICAGLLLVGLSHSSRGQGFDKATLPVGRQTVASSLSYPKPGCTGCASTSCRSALSVSYGGGVVDKFPDDFAPDIGLPDVAPDIAPDAALAPGQFAALDIGMFAASDNVGGYIDSAIPMTQVRMRYDIAWNADSDRAEYLYGAWSLFGGPTGLAVQRLDFHQVGTYVEWAFNPRFSGFVDLPVRFNRVTEMPGAPVDEGDPRTGGLADMNAGFKYALVANPDCMLTFQLRVIAPTGQAVHALGTGHAAIEPALLFQARPAQRWTVFGELRDWIGLGGTVVPADDQLPQLDPFVGRRFTGNVLQYGLGAGYDLHRSRDHSCRESRLTGVVEFVGWTLLNGLESDLAQMQIRDATGDTIVNGKYGLRYTHGVHSIYAGYGHAITDRAWYQDMLRLEYRRAF